MIINNVLIATHSHLQKGAAMPKRLLSLIVTLCLLQPSLAQAEDFVLTLKNHQFSPKELTLPAGEKIKLTIKNLDSTPAEFESTDLNREKVVAAKSEITVFIGPLDAGSYQFFDDFHRDTTIGTIIVK
jgi:plastocyanin